MPLHHTLLLPSSDRNPLTFESPLERFDNLSRNRTEKEKGVSWKLLFLFYQNPTASRNGVNTYPFRFKVLIIFSI